ncbi:MAG: UvrD-helicase domain-containing protein [Methanocorpusculum sp.]|nr:UvrD-helicase domain-containing protein [Methanocorpusculum sp.]
MNPTETQKLALDMTKSVCVTASAGTGKTFILTKRYIESLRTGHIDAGKILALTYTDKAAAEMREKIEREIRGEYSITGEFKEVLENIHKCSISTFHGFCASLLKEYPIEAGIEPGFSIMDDLDKSELVNNTVNEVLKNPPEFLRESVIHLYRHLAQKTIKEGFNAVIPKWDDCRPWFEKLKNNPEAVSKEWRDARDRAVIQMRKSILEDKKISELMDYFERAEARESSAIKKRLAAYNELIQAEGLSEIVSALNKLKIQMKKENIKNNHEIPLELLNYFIDCQKGINIYDAELLSGKYLEFEFSVLNAFAETVSEVCRRIKSEKERASALDFDDLIRYTSVLMENSDVVDSLRKRYDYILVDEVQDNDPILTGIVKKICGDSFENGRLFIVGDVKQSIYGFRGSDPWGFSELMNMFSSKPVSLDTSFRTVPEIIDCVNNIFSDVFDNSKIEYSRIEPSRKSETGSVTVLRNEDIKGSKADENAAAESELIASWIKENAGVLEVYENGKNRPSKFSDMAILLRTRTKLEILKRALEKYGVPYIEYKGRDFYKSQEIYDIVNVLKAAAFHEDDISLYGALRSSYFGISDAALCKSAFENSENLIDRLEKSKDAQIKSALESLKRYRKLAHEMTLVGLVNEIIRSSGIISVYSGLPSGNDEIANLMKFIEIVSAKTSGSAVSLPSLIKTMETCINEEISEESSLEDEDIDNSDRVKILTIHASKGLEYPVVILAFAANGKRNKGGFYFDKNLGTAFTLQHPDRKKIPSFVNEWAKGKLAVFEDEELRRLYYVGMTRARDHLAVSMTDSENISRSSFIGVHDIDAGEIISERCCLPEKTEDSTVFEPEEWDEIRADRKTEAVVNAADVGANEYILARGSCLHEIFAGADVSATAIRYGLSDCIGEFSEDLERFMDSSLMKDVIESFCELPVSAGDENKRIDRLIKYKNGSYAVIDYKSGSRENISDELMSEYFAQLTRYSEIMSEILSCSVPAYLYFVGGRSEDERIFRVL